MFIARTDSRNSGTPYNQQHGSKQQKEQGREQQSADSSTDDAIEISIEAVAPEPLRGAVVERTSVSAADEAMVIHIDIKV